MKAAINAPVYKVLVWSKAFISETEYETDTEYEQSGILLHNINSRSQESNVFLYQSSNSHMFPESWRACLTKEKVMAINLGKGFFLIDDKVILWPLNDTFIFRDLRLRRIAR